MIVEEIPFGFVERLAASCLVGHMLITYVARGSLGGQFRMCQDVSECFQFQPWPALKYCLMKSLGLICLFKFVYPADRIIRILRRFCLASQLLVSLQGDQERSSVEGLAGRV